MALSDVIKKIEDSPRSTKVAVFFAGTTLVAGAIAVFIAMQARNTSEPEPAKAASLYSTPARTMQVPSAPQLEPTAVPTKTPLPDPTKTPEPSPTPETVEEPTPSPTSIPTPAVTPTPEANDYYVVLYQGHNKNDDIGAIGYYASYPFDKNARGDVNEFSQEAFYLEYLRKEGVITSEQKNAYFNDEVIKIPMIPIATATYKLQQKDEFTASRLLPSAPEYLLHYADKSSVDSNESVSGVEGLLVGSDEGYVMINDGKISVSAVDDNGNTTTVNVEGVGAKELLDYWLSQNKITVQQVNQYGQTGQVQISLKDGVDLFDFGSSLDSGSSFGLDKETQDKIVNEVLPLFKFGD